MSNAITAPHWAKHLPGGGVIWVVIASELLTFGLFFGAYAAAYGADPETFRASQALLHPGSGAVNTAVLLTGSWMAARAVIAHRHGNARPWLAAAALSGVAFTAIKVVEYTHVFEHGVSLSTNAFWFYYLFLTVIHLLHVVVGIGILGWLAVKTTTQPSDHREAIGVEAGAAYWHMVDLIWIVLFPALYLVHP